MLTALAFGPAVRRLSGQQEPNRQAHQDTATFSTGVKVVNVFFGPLETEWFQTVPPPKVTPAALANAVIRALRQGVEDVFVGDVAEDIRARLAVNPKALERELAG